MDSLKAIEIAQQFAKLVLKEFEPKQIQGTAIIENTFSIGNRKGEMISELRT